MKKLLIFLALVSMLFAAGGHAPESLAVDGVYETQRVKTWTYSSLDTLAGDDSVKIYNNVGFDLGWEYILSCSALSGDSAATTVLQVIVGEYDNLDSLIKQNILDTIAAAGSKVVIPHGRKYFGSHYDIWLKSLNATSEAVIEGLWLYKRRPMINNVNVGQ